MVHANMEVEEKMVADVLRDIGESMPDRLKMHCREDKYETGRIYKKHHKRLGRNSGTGKIK